MLYCHQKHTRAHNFSILAYNESEFFDLSISLQNTENLRFLENTGVFRKHFFFFFFSLFELEMECLCLSSYFKTRKIRGPKLKVF